MQQLITLETIKSLNGKHIIQLDHDNPIPNLERGENTGFWIEKRIRYVTFMGTFLLDSKFDARTEDKQLILEHSVYCTESVRNFDEYITHFNKIGKSRFHRLLTASEIRWYAEELIKRNY